MESATAAMPNYIPPSTSGLAISVARSYPLQECARLGNTKRESQCSVSQAERAEHHRTEHQPVRRAHPAMNQNGHNCGCDRRDPELGHVRARQSRAPDSPVQSRPQEEKLDPSGNACGDCKTG